MNLDFGTGEKMFKMTVHLLYFFQKIQTGEPDQTVMIQISLLPKVQSDQELHCLRFHHNSNRHSNG